ncbi:hypothetical protein [Candidatus Nitronereus thalassa]|uniref:DUF1134 domain-containing protein n=1 Tax=Candidatus Nitronereus thalassa TaxID=3020898 RepID=A0ABU3K9B0_9BACT|nr:hypothetical protein [Candidatus Nitronereus thalassa]MDT7043045.1 hypothetical protein [Candidatus Nitronereus thalassa]
MIKHITRTWFFLCLALLLLCFPLTGFPEDQCKPANIKLKLTSAGIGLGAQWGEGQLDYEDGTYFFTMDGFGLADVGISSMSGKATISHLPSLSNFIGTYYSVGAGIAIGGGGIVISMANQNGVVMQITGSTMGLWTSVGPKGFTVKMK